MAESGRSIGQFRRVFSFADILFIFFTLCVLQTAGNRLMDDPGLGWHIRIADLMAEHGGFLEKEEFSFPTEGRPWVTRAWLSDVFLRSAYGWGGLNAIAVMTALVIALVLRLLYTRMVDEGVNWLVAALWTFLAALGTSPAWAARPNIVTFLGIVIAVTICERFHSGAISRRATLWLLPLFLLWPNMHGGFLAGVVVLAITWSVEGGLAVAHPKPDLRQAAGRRFRWLTGLGVALFAVTLVNPYGWNL